MISYHTLFKQTLKQYNSKMQNDPNFFRGRTEQEAMGYMVAINSFRDELMTPTLENKDTPRLSKALPVVSGSYDEIEIGKWLYDIELVARAQAKNLGDFTLSHEDIASKVFRNESKAPEKPSLEFLYSSIRIIAFVITLVFVYQCILVPTFSYIPKAAYPLLNNPLFSYTVILIVFLSTFYILSILPIPVVKIFYARNIRFFVALPIIAYIYILPFELLKNELETRANVFLATTVFLTLVTRSLFLNTNLPAGYHGLDVRRAKILLDVSSAELAATSTLLFIKPLNHILSIPYILPLWFIFLLVIAAILTDCISTHFDHFLSRFY